MFIKTCCAYPYFFIIELTSFFSQNSKRQKLFDAKKSTSFLLNPPLYRCAKRFVNKIMHSAPSVNVKHAYTLRNRPRLPTMHANTPSGSSSSSRKKTTNHKDNDRNREKRFKVQTSANVSTVGCNRWRFCSSAVIRKQTVLWRPQAIQTASARCAVRSAGMPTDR